MNRFRTMLAWALAAFLLGAGIAKGIDPAGFAAEIRNYRLLPWPGNAALALWLPPLEIVTGLALLMPGWRRAGLMVALVLLALFSGALLFAIARGLDIECGCFGAALPSASPAMALARNALLLVAAAFLLASQPPPPPSSPRD